MTMISGKAFWFKATGAPRPNKFNPKVPQWSFDLSVDTENQEKLLEKGMKASYLRNKDDERGVFLTFTRDSIKTDGSPGKPFRIVDGKNNPWPEGKEVGNGSDVNVVVSLNEREFRGQKFLKPSAIAVQIWNHVEYEAGFPTKEDDPETEEVQAW